MNSKQKVGIVLRRIFRGNILKGQKKKKSIETPNVERHIYKSTFVNPRLEMVYKKDRRTKWKKTNGYSAKAEWLRIDFG